MRSSLFKCYPLSKCHIVDTVLIKSNKRALLPGAEPCDDIEKPNLHTTQFVPIPKEHKSDCLAFSLSLSLSPCLSFSLPLSQHINCVNVGAWLPFPVLLQCINMETQLYTHTQELSWKQQPIFSHIISEYTFSLRRRRPRENRRLVLNSRNCCWWRDCFVANKHEHDQRCWIILLCLFLSSCSVSYKTALNY